MELHSQFLDSGAHSTSAHTQGNRCPPCHSLLVGRSNNDTALLLGHRDAINILWVGEISNPPLETCFSVLAHEDGLWKANQPRVALDLLRSRMTLNFCFLTPPPQVLRLQGCAMTPRLSRAILGERYKGLAPHPPQALARARQETLCSSPWLPLEAVAIAVTY